ncbi:MAG: DNA-binding response OmpR family regulator [Verrucomicrobiales bacterium]|jgi:DNA-binding response OmpR family regulator
MRLLLAEDSKHHRNYLAKVLRQEGYAVDTAPDGEEGLLLATTNTYDAIILDVMMPKMDGFEVLQTLREQGCATHVLMLTARTHINDRVAGLQMGADDYLVKPFALEEMLARVQALVRRDSGHKTNRLVIGELIVDTTAHTATIAGRQLQLRPREFALLEYLATRQGHIVGREDIENHIFDHAKEVKSNSVDSAVSKLRKELHGDRDEVYLRTVHRQGYVLEAP